jgi:hypothetical protein
MATVIDTKIMLVIYAVLIGLSTSLEVQVLQDRVFAYHGKEVSQVLDYGHFVPLTIDKANQVKVIVNYTVKDPSIIGKDINAVMKVYNLNGTLLKTSSFLAGLALNETGKAQLATSFTDTTIKNVTAVVAFVNTTNNLPLSNPLTVKLNFEKAR